jgi:hypothetical protein
MGKKVKLQVSDDGIIPVITDDIKVVYSDNEINSNWLLNKILGSKNKQITKISDDELNVFLTILQKSNLEMPDGSNSLIWLKERINKRFEQTEIQRGHVWEEISRRYQYILQRIDILLATRKHES